MDAHGQERFRQAKRQAIGIARSPSAVLATLRRDARTPHVTSKLNLRCWTVWACIVQLYGACVDLGPCAPHLTHTYSHHTTQIHTPHGPSYAKRPYGSTAC